MNGYEVLNIRTVGSNSVNSQPRQSNSTILTNLPDISIVYGAGEVKMADWLVVVSEMNVILSGKFLTRRTFSLLRLARRFWRGWRSWYILYNSCISTQNLPRHGFQGELLSPVDGKLIRLSRLKYLALNCNPTVVCFMARIANHSKCVEKWVCFRIYWSQSSDAIKICLEIQSEFDHRVSLLELWLAGCYLFKYVQFIYLQYIFK